MDQDLLKKLRERSEKNNFSNLLGIDITEIEYGSAVVSMEVKKDFLNPLNTVHGGCLFSLADVASGAAAVTLGLPSTTLSYDFHFLRPAFENTRLLIARAQVVKQGKRVIVIDVSVEDENGRQLCKGIASHTPLELDLGE